MTFEEAKKILEKEGFKLEERPGKPYAISGEFTEFEDPNICEAMQVVSSAGYAIMMAEAAFNARKARLKEELKEYANAPVSGKEKSKEENPALKESASQFNDALLDEQAKEIKCIKEKNLRLGKEIARLNKNIYKKNMKIEELRKESSRHLRGKIKMFGENVDLEQMLKDKDAVLSDVAEELRLSKIREKNLTEVSQKYMKENEELREKVAEKTKLVEMVRKGSKEYCEYGIAAEKMIQKMAKDIVNDRPVSPKDYEQYRLWAKGYRFNPQLPELTDEEEKKLNTAKSTLDDLKKKAYEFFNAKACNLGLVGSKDGNGIIDQMIGVDIAEEGGDLSGVFVLFGKDFIDALKKVKDVWQE